MENKINNNKTNKEILDISNFESFLIKSGYISPKTWTKKNSDLLNINKFNEIISVFVDNDKITPTEASVKFGEKVQWINKRFKCDLKLEELHSQYIHYTSTNIPFNKLLNNFIMLQIILENFYNVINKNNEENINNIFNKKIIMNDIDINSSLHNKNILGLKQKLDLIYDKVKRSPIYNGKDANYNLICILFLLSMGSSFSVDKNIPQISNLMNLFTLYNKIYLNDIHISFILYINVIIYINLYIYSNKKKSNFKSLIYDNKNINIFFYQDFKKKLNSEKINEQNENNQNYISLFFFDNDIITYNGEYFFELLIFQNYLKLYSIYHLNKNQIKLTINLTIDTMFETLKTFSDNVIIDSKTNKITNNFYSQDDNIKQENIKLSNLLLLTRANIIKCFSIFNFNELLIKVTNFQSQDQVREINLNYFELIQKAKKLYFQNPISALNQSNISNKNNNQTETDIKKEDNSLKNLKEEFKVLEYLLNYYHKMKEAKKNLQFYCFKFRFFKCSVFREGQKEIQLFFDYSSVKEKILFKYLKNITNLLSLIKQYENILEALTEFKLYKITFRVNQTNFRSHHINFYFMIIVKKLTFYIEDNKLNRINIYDSKLKINEENMFVYIKDNSIKVKSRMNIIKEIINESCFKHKLKVFNEFLKELAEDWDIIIIGEDLKYYNISYSTENNILLMNIVKDINDNSVQNFMASSSIIAMSVNPITFGNDKMNQPKNKANYEYLNILMYIKKSEDFADKVLKFSESIKSNNNCVLDNKITLISERYFFEESIIMNSRIKEGKQIYNFIDNYFLICDKKKDDEFYKYDLYITKTCIYLVNNISQEVSKDFSAVIYSLISTLSSCIELILYLLKNKETDPEKFYYIQRIKNEYYFFLYKKRNFFLKKLKGFDSLLLFNPRNHIPLFCILADNRNVDDMESIENFQDLFLRLFLNLNKVVESDKLNENFFEKIYKNLFFDNYDIYKIMAFSYESFLAFNELFIINKYFEISKNSKFETCYIMPYEIDPTIKKEKFQKILEYQKSDKLVVTNIKIYDYNLTHSFLFKNINDLKMSFNKTEFFIKYHRKSKEINNSLNNKLMYIYKILKNKKFKNKDITKIINNIKQLFYENNSISCYNSNTSILEKFLIEFNTEQVKIKALKLTHKSLHI